MRALAVVGVLVVFALVFIGVALVRDTQSDGGVAVGCPEGWKRADLTLREQKDVKIRVLNATETQGLASTVATDFENRKFQVVEKGNDPKRVDGVAVLRYGPQAVGSWHLLRAYFLDEATPEYDPNRTDDVVDVVIGNGFQQLATITEVHQALVELGKPELPPQTCAEDQES
nr:LytR C-terminal domain-containing protein [Micromonospora sp. DSM 115978]